MLTVCLYKKTVTCALCLYDRRYRFKTYQSYLVLKLQYIFFFTSNEIRFSFSAFRICWNYIFCGILCVCVCVYIYIAVFYCRKLIYNFLSLFHFMFHLIVLILFYLLNNDSFNFSYIIFHIPIAFMSCLLTSSFAFLP